MTQNESLYEATNFDGLERRGNYRLIAYREDVLHMLDKKDAGAIVWQIVYRWQTEYKRPEVLKKIEERKKAGLKPYTPEEIEGMMYVYMSYNDFVRESGHAIGYNTVIRMLDYLVNVKKVLKQRPNHDPKYPDFEYSVNKEVTRKLLKELPIDPAFAPKIPKKKNKSTQMGTADRSTQIGTRSTQTGIASTQMGTEVYPFGGTSHNYSHTTHSNHTKENTYVVLSNDENDAPTPFFLTLSEGTPLLDHFTLAHPLTIQIEQTSEGYLVSEPTYANHTVASTQDEALTAFKRSLVEEMHLLSQDESHLGKHLAEKLAFLRGHIREEVTQAETIQPANGVEIPHPERENSSFSEATQPLAPNTQPTTTPSPEFDSQREREALAQQEQQQANAKSEASDLRIAEETTNITPPVVPASEKKTVSGKRGGKKTVAPDLSPIAPPARPDPALPFTAEKILQWGDYVRRSTLTFSNKRDTKSYKAREAARRIEGLGYSEEAFLSLYVNWMKGIKLDLDPLPEDALKSETWTEYPVDLWVFAEHCEDELKKYKRAKAEQKTLKEKRDDAQRTTTVQVGSSSIQIPTSIGPYKAFDMTPKPRYRKAQ